MRSSHLRRHAANTCDNFDGQMASVAPRAREARLGLHPEGNFGAWYVSDRRLQLPERSSRGRGSHCEHGFRLCGS